MTWTKEWSASSASSLPIQNWISSNLNHSVILWFCDCIKPGLFAFRILLLKAKISPSFVFSIPFCPCDLCPFICTIYLPMKTCSRTPSVEVIQHRTAWTREPESPSVEFWMEGGITLQLTCHPKTDQSLPHRRANAQ